MLNEDIVIQRSLMPFRHDFETLHLENCKTVQEIVDKLVPFNFVDCNLCVTLNNKYVSSEDWGNYQLKKGDLVGLNFIPTGGGGDGKNVVMTIAVIAAAVAVPALAGAAGLMAGNAAVAAGAGAFGAGIGGFTGLAAGAYALGYGATLIAGSMLLSLAQNSLMSTPNQSYGSAGSIRDSQTQFVEGASNAINRYGVVPINLGTNRMFPNQAALPYTESAGSNQYCRQLFTYGYGKLQISERKLGDTLLSEFEDVELNDRLDGDLDEGVKLYSNDIYEENLSVNLTKELGSVVRVTQSDIDECIFDLTFNGLAFVVDAGKYAGLKLNTTVSFKVEYALNDTEDWINVGDLTITDNTTRTFRYSKRIVFDTRGTYKIRITRLTDDTDASNILNKSYLTAIRSIKYSNPVNFKNISGTAMRIKATDQLNGTVDSYNVIATSLVKSYNVELGIWENDKPSSNPADLFRYVLQSPAFAKSLKDEQIDIDKLEEWAKYCAELKLTYDKIIDYDTSVDDVLNDICAAGVAALSKVNNVYSVIIDNERPIIKGLVTPRNSWEYSGNIKYPDIPHALRIEFRNKDKGYETDERIVYADGYDENNATLYERLEFSSCTNADLAYWYGRRYFATALLQPETHTFKMDFETMTFNRGDRIQLVNDVILVGVGQGRITSLDVDDSDNVIGFTIDDTLTIPQITNLGVRIRDNNAKGIDYYALYPVQGDVNSFSFITPLSIEEAPAIGSLCAFTEDDKQLDLIITEIKYNNDLTATITAIDYAPERFTPLEEIPEFESNITISEDFYKPVAPVLDGEVQSDESVMIKNSDGSLTSVMVIPLRNLNKDNVLPVIKCRVVGATQWFTPSSLKRDSSEVVLVGLNDGSNYDIEIRYQRQTGLQLLSSPLKINNIKFVGGSTPPKDVQNFKVTVTNGIALFEWTPNDDIDISHYVIKFSADTEDVIWESAQIAVERVTGNTVTGLIHKGMYLIKAVDITGNESKNATTILSIDSGAFNNVVENLIQEPDWLGKKEDVRKAFNAIALAPEKNIGYYYFNPEPLDLGEVYECSLSSNIKASIVDRNRVRDIVKIRDVPSIRNFGQNKRIRNVPSIRELTSVRTFEDGQWSTQLEMCFSNDNISWSNWQTFSGSQHTFRYCKFRIGLYCLSNFYNVNVLKASVIVDMPDRYENGEDIEITDANVGGKIKYKNAFWNNPSVNITVQNGAVDDKIEYIEKNNKGFTFKIFNATLDTYVKRSFDYISAGYGKVVE